MRKAIPCHDVIMLITYRFSKLHIFSHYFLFSFRLNFRLNKFILTRYSDCCRAAFQRDCHAMIKMKPGGKGFVFKLVGVRIQFYKTQMCALIHLPPPPPPPRIKWLPFRRRCFKLIDLLATINLVYDKYMMTCSFVISKIVRGRIFEFLSSRLYIWIRFTNRN